MDLGNPSCRFPICSNRLIPVLATTVASRHGGCSYSDRHGRTTLVRRDNAMAKDSETIESVQQGVPVYDPQLVAMRWSFLAAKVYSTAVGRA